MGDVVIIRIGGHERQVALQRRGSNKGIDLPNQARTMGWPYLAPDGAIAMEHGVGEEVGINRPQEAPKTGQASREVREALQIFHDLSVHENAGRQFVPGEQRGEELDHRRAAHQIGS